MSGNPQIAPAGSSRYDSNTLHIGDGTWDSERDTFLLPPLLGVNFNTMVYNGASFLAFGIVYANGILSSRAC